MSGIIGPGRVAIYSGPAEEFFEPDRFNHFVRTRVVAELEPQGQLNPEGSPPNVIYHFPHASIGLRYFSEDGRNCVVDLLVMPRGRGNVYRIQKLIERCKDES